MWRPVALTAFLALLFMTARSGQPPTQPDRAGAAKGDLGAESRSSDRAVPEIRIDLTSSSVHSKTGVVADPEADLARKPSTGRKDVKADRSESGQQTRFADLSAHATRTIPLPTPKSGGDAAVVRVIVTEGEQKTALTSGEEEALSLMPPGPDFPAKVQRELVRLGCYVGRVDNIWGPMSRNAVARFNRMAKSKLPLKQPTRALLSSARKAPDGYCAGAAVASDGQPKVAGLEPGGGIEALENRPSYLPPWMRGEPMPAPDENRATREPEPETKPEQPATRTAAREEPRTPPTSAPRAERGAVQRAARAQQRAQRRRTRSFGSVMDSRGAFWPGQ